MAKATGYFTSDSERKQLDPAPIEEWFRETGRTVQADFLLELARIADVYRSMRAAWDHAPNSPDLRKWLADFSGHARALTNHANALAYLLGERSDVGDTGRQIVSIAIGDIIGSAEFHANLLSVANACDRTIDQLSANERGGNANIPWDNLVRDLAGLYEKTTGKAPGFQPSGRAVADDFAKYNSRRAFLQFLRAMLQAIGEPEQRGAQTFEKAVERALRQRLALPPRLSES